jgi:hypothetical protein
MISLRQAAQAAKGELWQIEVIDVDKAEIKEETFIKTEKGSDGKETTKAIAYKVMVIDGKKYTIRDKQINLLKELLEKKPACKKVKLFKFDDGKLAWLALD